MSVWITSTIGAVTELPDEIGGVDINKFYNSDTLYDLESLALPFGYSLSYESLEDNSILIFGKRGNIIFDGVYSGWFEPLSSVITPKDFPTEEEKKAINIALQSFLESLPEEYNWVKELPWMPADTYLHATS